MMLLHPIAPTRDRFAGMPIGKDCITWPHGANVLTTVRVLQEHTAVIAICVNRVVVGSIVRVRDVYCAVDDWNIVLSVRMEALEEFLAGRNGKGIGITGEGKGKVSTRSFSQAWLNPRCLLRKVSVLEHVVNV